MNYDLHPLCTLFPRMGDAEFASLVEDIKTNGLRQPITLHEKMILDGGNRYRACIEAGVEPAFVQFDGGNLVSFVLSANLHRRHMSAGQQAAIVASAQDWANAQTRGGDRRSDAIKVSPDTLKTAEARAAVAGVSIATQKRADKVAKADPKLVQQVAQGRVSLPDAVEAVSGKKKAKPKKATPVPTLVTPEGEDLSDAMDTDPTELLEELQRENESLLSQIKTLTAEDTKAELRKMILQRDHAIRQQSEAMDNAQREQKAHAYKHRQLMRCGKAVGEDDPSKIAAAVEAFVRQYKKAA